jgi:transposase-like protein
MSDSEHTAKSEPARRSDVLTGARRRRKWSAEQKARIVAESYAGGETVCAVALRHGLTSQQLSGWRRHARRRAEGRPPENGARTIVTVRACEGTSGQSQPAALPETPAIEIAIWRHDGTCAIRLVLVAKQRGQGSFRWPTIRDGVMRLTPARLSALLAGLDWTGVRAVGVRALQAPQFDATDR